ncbi:MAG: hypothetical protein ACRDOY_07030 [Nocardioidaceae bacterium]
MTPMAGFVQRRSGTRLAAGTPRRLHGWLSRTSAPVAKYRVDYDADGDAGIFLLRTRLTSPDRVATQATDVLRRQGIDAQIRRIVPVAD